MADNSDEVLLLQRYGQIEQRLQSYDRTIHNSFYLSLVYVGAVVATLGPLSDRSVFFTLVLLFSALASAGLLGWSYRAMRDRLKSNRRKAKIEQILSNDFNDRTSELSGRRWRIILANQSDNHDEERLRGQDYDRAVSFCDLSSKEYLVLGYYGVLAVATLLVWRLGTPLA